VTSRAVPRRGKTVVTVALLWLLALVATIASAQNATAAPAPAWHPPVVMVLLDTHLARPGQRVPGLRVAATRTYVGALPANVRVGLITFDAHWQLLLPPTADRSRLRQALRSAQGNGPDSNGIYAAITGAESLLRQLGTSGRLVILSNAENVISRPSFKPTVPIDIVPWHYDNDDNIVELRVLAAASRGHVAAPRVSPRWPRYSRARHLPPRPPAAAPLRPPSGPLGLRGS